MALNGETPPLIDLIKDVERAIDLQDSACADFIRAGEELTRAVERSRELERAYFQRKRETQLVLETVRQAYARP